MVELELIYGQQLTKETKEVGMIVSYGQILTRGLVKLYQKYTV
jgi:hypothetical protein